MTPDRDELKLYGIKEVSREELGRLSHSTLLKHIALGNVKVTRIGRRVFLTGEEVVRIQREGLPSLHHKKK